jgi:iron complex outermembrane receptor protein
VKKELTMKIEKILLNFFLNLSVMIVAFQFPVAAEDTEDNVHRLEKISVTATRMERDTSDVPASIDVAGEDEIEDTKMFNIKEVMDGMPGVLIESPNQGYDARIIIRGAGLKARYGVRDIMILLDGVPITDPDGFSRLDFIDTQLIERVEVVKGPNSTMWGANAAGGTINIITKNPMEMSGGIAKVGIGNYDTRNYNLSYSSKAGDMLYYTVSGSIRETGNDWRRWNEFDTRQGSIQATLLFDDGSTLDNFFGYTDASIQLPGKLDQTMFDNYLTTGLAPETEGAWQYSGRYSEVYFFNSRLTKEIGNFEIKPMFFINSWEHLHPVTGRINTADTTTYGGEIQVNNSHKLFSARGTVSFGATARIDDQKTDYYKYADYLTGYGGRVVEVLSDAKGDLIEIEDRKVDLYGLYAQESLVFNDRWILDLGIRYDDVNFDITGTRTEDFDYGAGMYVPAGDPDPVDKSFGDFSPRIGATFRINEIFNAFAQAAKGVQTPTDSELTDNPNLELVEVDNYEIGLKARAEKYYFDTSIYYSPVKNEVVQVIGEGGISEYVNSGETEKKGFEFSGAYFLLPSLELGGTYSYTDYTFKDFSEPVRVGAVTVDLDRSGNTLPYIPENQYSVFAAYRHAGGFRTRIQAMSWGSYYIDNANTEKYKGYDFITSAMIGYSRGNWDAILSADNLFDERYAIEVEKDTRAVVRYVPAAPRSIIFVVTYKF